MKKYILGFILMLGVVSAHAQFQWGLTAGTNTSKVSFSNVPEANSGERAGWYFGPKVQFTVPVVGLGLNVAATYSQRRLNTNGESTNYRSLEFPINLRYQIGISLAKVYVQTGPQFGFQMGNSVWDLPSSEQFQLKKSNVSWNIGAGVFVLKHLELGLGYNFAVSKCAKLMGNEGSSIKANSLQFQVAYMF